MQKIEHAKTVRLNGVQALKRAFMHRGLVFKTDAADPVVSSRVNGKMTESESIMREKLGKERAKHELNSSSDINYSESARQTAKLDKAEKKQEAQKEENKPSQKKIEKQLEAIEQALQEIKSGESDKSESSGSSDKKGKKASSESEAESKAEKKIERNPMLAAAKGESNLKNEMLKKPQSSQRIEELKTQTEDILYETETVFPFTLFPDTLKLDREKFTMAKREFFRTATISSVPVSEIMSVEANVGPFFGSLHLIFRFFNDNEKTFTFLPRQDAINLQRLIHGFIIAHHKGIDLAKVPTNELRETLTQIGQGVED